MAWVRHVPWNRYTDQPDADGESPEDQAVEAKPVDEQAVQEPRTVVKMKQPPPEGFSDPQGRCGEAWLHPRVPGVLELVPWVGPAGTFTSLQGEIRRALEERCQVPERGDAEDRVRGEGREQEKEEGGE